MIRLFLVLFLLFPICSHSFEFDWKGKIDVQNGFNEISHSGIDHQEQIFSGEITTKIKVMQKIKHNEFGASAKIGANTNSKRYMNKEVFDQYSAFLKNKKGKIEIGKSFGVSHLFQTGAANLSNSDEFHPVNYSLLESLNQEFISELKYDHDLAIIKPGLWSEQPDPKEKNNTIEFFNKRVNSAKISYISPQISNLRFGASYIPNIFNMQEWNKSKEGFKNILQMGIIFAKQFKNFSLKSSLSGEYGKTINKSRYNLRAWEGGVNVSYMGVILGASYGSWNNSGMHKEESINKKNSYYWATGVSYSISHLTLKTIYLNSKKRLSYNNVNNNLEDITLKADYRILPNFTMYVLSSRHKLQSISIEKKIKGFSFIFGSKFTF